MIKGTIFNIQRFAINDGPGIRTTVFLKGCPLQCGWCHNPESQYSAPQLLYFETRCIRCGACIERCPNKAISMNSRIETNLSTCSVCGACLSVCPADAREIVGRWMTVDEVMLEIKKDIPFYQQSAGGVTFSGGEPLAQIDFLITLLNECRQEGIHTAVDTCGYAPWPVLQKAAKEADLFLYDLKIMDDASHIQHTGFSNKMILENLKHLADTGADIIVRVPLVPGITDNEENIKQISEFVASMKNLSIDLLPFHNIAESKYERLGKRYAFSGPQHTNNKKLNEIKALFETADITVSIGD